MNINKYINKMAEYFDVEKRKCTDQKKCLKQVLKKLNKREKTLKEQLAAEHDEKIKKDICDEIEILHKKRNKGLKALKELCKKDK